MNEHIKQLKLHAGIQDNPDQEGLDLFAEMIVKDFYDICNQAWAFNEQEKAKEGASQAEQLVFAGAMAQCQKMKENIEQQFGIKE
jgi:predicted ester cyclase